MHAARSTRWSLKSGAGSCKRETTPPIVTAPRVVDRVGARLRQRLIPGEKEKPFSWYCATCHRRLFFNSIGHGQPKRYLHVGSGVSFESSRKRDETAFTLRGALRSRSLTPLTR